MLTAFVWSGQGAYPHHEEYFSIPFPTGKVSYRELNVSIGWQSIAYWFLEDHKNIDLISVQELTIDKPSISRCGKTWNSRVFSDSIVASEPLSLRKFIHDKVPRDELKILLETKKGVSWLIPILGIDKIPPPPPSPVDNIDKNELCEKLGFLSNEALLECVLQKHSLQFLPLLNNSKPWCLMACSSHTSFNYQFVSVELKEDDEIINTSLSHWTSKTLETLASDKSKKYQKYKQVALQIEPSVINSVHNPSLDDWNAVCAYLEKNDCNWHSRKLLEDLSRRRLDDVILKRLAKLCSLRCAEVAKVAWILYQILDIV